MGNISEIFRNTDSKVEKYAQKHLYQKWQVWIGLVVVVVMAFGAFKYFF